ncbi:MAG TPA: 5'-nucleotidase [Actinokineospora sp.]|jgi:5'-nucleotidase|nr:5'-nucleotidase [Actinokineospora sp.]
MPYSLDDRLVIGIASSALFDLAKSDKVFRKHGVRAYREYQEERLSKPLRPGVAFPFIKRLLSLNGLTEENNPLVEVIVLSKNSPDTGLRVMRSIKHHALPITRAIFQQGRSPFGFMHALNMSLFLSGSQGDVRQAVGEGLPAGCVIKSEFVDDEEVDLRIAFDFDGVLADDESERVMQGNGLEKFHEHETTNLAATHNPGPLKDFLKGINRIQQREEEKRLADPKYRVRVRVSVVTARNAPSHERAVLSLKEWGLRVNDAFFLGGIDKSKVLQVLKPHLFFDDQKLNLETAALTVPCVHVPFGVINEGVKTK